MPTFSLRNSSCKVTACQGRYPLLDAATFRVHHVDLKINGPSRYGTLAVSMRGWFPDGKVQEFSWGEVKTSVLWNLDL